MAQDYARKQNLKKFEPSTLAPYCSEVVVSIDNRFNNMFHVIECVVLGCARVRACALVCVRSYNCSN